MSELATRLEALGLTHNEALTYLCLLEGEGLTGYQVAAQSAVPRSAVYGVLRRLEERGAAFATGEDPVRYAATDPAQFVSRLRGEAERRLDGLQDALATVPRRSRPEPVWTLSRYEEVLARAAQMLAAARRSAWLSAWPREIAALEPSLGACGAAHRVLHSPAAVSVDGWAVWHGELDAAQAGWHHRLVLVVDRREVLLGGAEPEADNHAVWTTNPSLVDLAVDHLVLDLTLLARARGVDPGGLVAPMMRPHLS